MTAPVHGIGLAQTGAKLKKGGGMRQCVSFYIEKLTTGAPHCCWVDRYNREWRSGALRGSKTAMIVTQYSQPQESAEIQGF